MRSERISCIAAVTCISASEEMRCALSVGAPEVSSRVCCVDPRVRFSTSTSNVVILLHVWNEWVFFPECQL